MTSANYIQSALIRIDYVPIDSLTNALPKVIRDAVAKQFPNMEFREIDSRNIELSPEGQVVSHEMSKINEWHFNTVDAQQQIIITNNSLLLKSKRDAYVSFDTFLSKFLVASNAVEQVCPGCTLTRIGLRYVNVVKKYLEDGKLNNKYLTEITSVAEEERVRIITSAETKTDDHRMRVQYGLMNPDYPSVDVKSEFVIDLDAYCEGLYYLSELMNIAEELHECIEEKYHDFINTEVEQ